MTGVAAILLAGGSGSRVEREVNKVYLPIRDREMLAYSYETLHDSPAIERLVVVIRTEDSDAAHRVIGRHVVSKPTTVVVGGATRHASEHNALESIAGEIETGVIQVVVLHDGARPFATGEMVLDVVQAARNHGGALPVLPMEENLFRVDEANAKLLDPARIRKAQTPQAFRALPLLRAFRAAGESGFHGVDTSETVAAYSRLDLVTVPGDPRNIKVTFVEDLFRAEDLAPDWHAGRWRTPAE